MYLIHLQTRWAERETQEIRVRQSCQYGITSASDSHCPRCGFNLDHASDEASLVEWGESVEREAKLAEWANYHKPPNTRNAKAAVFFLTGSPIVFVIASYLLYHFFVAIGWYVDSGGLPVLSAGICAVPIALGVGTLGARRIAQASSNRK